MTEEDLILQFFQKTTLSLLGVIALSYCTAQNQVHYIWELSGLKKKKYNEEKTQNT